MHDAHVHLDFMSNGEQVAQAAGAAGVSLFATTVTPDDYLHARSRFGEFSNVRVGLGLHPWWIGQTRPPTFDEIAQTRFIGEVGLDFGKKHGSTRDAQLAAFSDIARACASQGDKILSIHSVQAAREVLDVLETHGTMRSCTCIFHWYSGPSDQLKRAIDAGCYFSVGPRMALTRKGREYVKAIPAKRMLTETDAPPGRDVEFPFSELHDELTEVAQTIAAIKGEGALAEIESTFQKLFLR